MGSERRDADLGRTPAHRATPRSDRRPCNLSHGFDSVDWLIDKGRRFGRRARSHWHIRCLRSFAESQREADGQGSRSRSKVGFKSALTSLQQRPSTTRSNRSSEGTQQSHDEHRATQPFHHRLPQQQAILAVETSDSGRSKRALRVSRARPSPRHDHVKSSGRIGADQPDVGGDCEGQLHRGNSH